MKACSRKIYSSVCDEIIMMPARLVPDLRRVHGKIRESNLIISTSIYIIIHAQRTFHQHLLLQIDHGRLPVLMLSVYLPPSSPPNVAPQPFLLLPPIKPPAEPSSPKKTTSPQPRSPKFAKPSSSSARPTTQSPLPLSAALSQPSVCPPPLAPNSANC